MQRRPLGHSDIQVPPLCLGTMTWGEQNSAAEGFEQMDAALDLGIDFFDTAEMYPVPPRAETYTRTESIIGDWFAARGTRDRVVLATKMCGPGRHDYVRGGARMTRASVVQAVEASLGRLRTDRIDLYQLHWPDRNVNRFGTLGMASLGDDPDTVPLEETLGALGDLVAQGKIRAIGLSNETSWGVMRAVHLAETMGVPRIVTVQNAYNLLNRYTEINLAEVLMRERIGLLPYSPLAMGVLTGKYLGGARPAGARITLFPHYTRYLTPRGEEATAAYVALAREAGLDPARMALAYVIGRRFVVSTIIGQTSIAQLRNDAEAARLVLPADLVKAIEAIHAANPNPCA